MTIDDGTAVTTKLLTLLNVSATKLGKRKQDEFIPAEKLNKRKSISFSDTVSIRVIEANGAQEGIVQKEGDAQAMEVDEKDEDSPGASLYSSMCPFLTSSSI